MPVTVVRGADWIFPFTVKNPDGSAFDLSSVTITAMIAVNIIVGTYAEGTGIVVTDAAAGTFTLTISATDPVQDKVPAGQHARLDIIFTDLSNQTDKGSVNVKLIVAETQETTTQDGIGFAMASTGIVIQMISMQGLQGPVGPPGDGPVLWESGNTPYATDRQVILDNIIWKALRSTSVQPSDSATDDWEKVFDYSVAVDAEAGAQDAATAAQASQNAAGSSAGAASSSASAAANSAASALASAENASQSYYAFDTLAHLNSFDGTSVNQSAIVWGDPVEANNGVYSWNGSSWDRIADIVNTQVAAIQDSVDLRDRSNTNSGVLDNEAAWQRLTNDYVGLVGVNRGGWLDIGPRHKKDFLVQDTGVSPNRQIWIKGKGMSPRRISTDGDGDCHSPYIVGGNRLRWSSGDAGSMVDKEVLLSGSMATVAAGVTKIVFVAWYGQSNRNGNDSFSVVSATPMRPGYVLMFSPSLRFHRSSQGRVDGERKVDPRYLLNIVDASEQLEGVTSGESGLTSFMAAVQAWYGDTVAVLGVNAAIGSHGYTQLKSGTIPWNNLMYAARQAFNVATINGYDFDWPFMGYNGNEGDIFDSAATTETKRVELFNDFKAEADALCSNATSRLLIYTQTGNNSNYNTLPTVAMGQLQAAIDHPTEIVCAGQAYQDATAPDGTHKLAAGQLRAGVTEGRYAYNWLNGDDSLPPYFTAASAASNVITLTPHMPYLATGLEFDTTTSPVSDPGNKGFTFYQTGGSALTVTAVAIVSGNIQVTLSGAIDGTSPQVGIAWDHPSGITPAGPTTGSRATLRTTGSGGGYVKEYFCQQLINVT
jgi:hypothetical protein